MQRANLMELNAVVAVANHKSFRKAAKQLGFSPSALSHAVSELERRMAVRLFNRTTRSVALSEAGERFLSRVGPALAEISDAMESATATRDTPSGVLRINSPELAAREILMPHILAFLRLYPEMRVDLVTDGRLIDIVSGGFDAGVRLAEAVPQDMIAVPLGPPLRHLIVGAPAYLEKRGVPTGPDDLTSHDCIRRRLPSGAVLRWELERRGQEVEVEVSGPLTLDSHDLMLQAALEGHGLAWVVDLGVRDHIAAGRLNSVLDDWTPAYPGLRVYYPGHRHVPAGLKAFTAMLRQARNAIVEG